MLNIGYAKYISNASDIAEERMSEIMEELKNQTVQEESEIQKLLKKYISHPEDPENNFSLGLYYHEIGQTASAVSYYLRTAERTNDDLLKYESLVRASMCFDSQGCRGFTVKGLLQHAIAILPKRPEAYFLLSRFYEREKTVESWKECYLIASVGHSVCEYENNTPLRTSVDYPGDYAILFEKAVSSWWCGLCDESRKLFRHIRDNYELDQIHQNAVRENLEKMNESKKDLHAVYLPKRYKNFDWGDTDDEYIELFTKENFIHRTYEKHFSVKSGDIVVDVGANCGSFTCSILESDPKHVYCLEPSLNLVNALKNNTSNDNNVTIVPKAISNQNTETSNRDGVHIYCDDQETFQTITFSKFIEENNISEIDFLKTDCEGGEYFIFTPENANFIKNNVKRVAGEFHISKDLWKNGVENFKIFRDYYLKDIRYSGAFHVYERCGKDVTQKIFDDSFLHEFDEWWTTHNPYFCQFMVYVDYEEAYKNGTPVIEVQELDQIKTNFSINQSINSTCWVVDNFYENPDEVRKFALKQDYVEGGFGRGFIGRRTYEQFLFPGLKERFEQIMGRRITAWEEHGMNGRFQIAWSGEPLVYHCDSQRWGGMLYLTPEAPYQCGTTLYAHKKTRARSYHDEGWNASWENVPGDAHLDRTPFEPVDVMGNVYNRLVIFDASCIHSASEYFGTVKENARLWQMFFFDTD